MWCEQCQSDVATEISADGQQLLCTTCSQPVRKVVAPSLHPDTKSAREFLERWAREQQGVKVSLDKPKPTPTVPVTQVPSEIPASATPVTPPPAPTIAAVEKITPPAAAEPETPPASRKKLRLDSEHTSPEGPIPTRRDRPRRPHHLEKVDAAPVSDNQAPPEKPPVIEQAMEKNPEPQYRLDDAQAVAAGPHFDVRTVAPQRTIYPGRSEAMWGQLMAYAGTGLLTVGTVFVLWGYFGEIETYASTGWLMSTAGQMLLLLGIVTLVGGGMQQTTHEVTQRIEHLGGRIIRIEESTDKILKGPHFNRSRRRARKNAGGDQEAA